MLWSKTNIGKEHVSVVWDRHELVSHVPHEHVCIHNHMLSQAIELEIDPEVVTTFIIQCERDGLRNSSLEVQL